MIKEGEKDVTLRYLSDAPRTTLAINTFTDVQTQGQNIRLYSDYLIARAQGYADTKVDYVRSGIGRMKHLKISKGLLRETESVQDQIKALVKCDVRIHTCLHALPFSPFVHTLTFPASGNRKRKRDIPDRLPPSHKGPHGPLRRHERGRHERPQPLL